jgi:hypothetical protein
MEERVREEEKRRRGEEEKRKDYLDLFRTFD